MLQRKAFRDVAGNKLRHLQFGWLARRAWAWASLKADARLRTGRAPAPLMAVLLVTGNCNLRCPMCDLPDRFRRSPGDNDTDSWKLVIDQLRQMGAAGIGFTGGEATVRKDIFDLIRYARDYGFPVTLNTNGYSLSEQRLDELVASDPTNINISVDSGRDDVNARLRGGTDVLSRSLQTIRRLDDRRRAAGRSFALTVVTVLSDDNVNDLEILFDKVASAGADRIGFMPLHDVAGGSCGVRACAADVSAAVSTIRRLSARYRLPLENSDDYLDALPDIMSRRKLLPVRCNAGYTTLMIAPDFTLYRCWGFFEKQRAFRPWNPHAERLNDIWNDKAFRDERLGALSCKECFWNCHAELSYLIRM